MVRVDTPEFLYPDWPAPANVHAVSTTRAGGASTGAYESFNLADHVGDAPANVANNRARLRAALALPADPVWMKQVHGVHVIDGALAPAGVEADGAYANRKNVVCAVLAADCLPMLICNREGTEVGILHAGWRGLAHGIVEAGLKALRSPVDELLVWLGPAIGAKAYEVGADVREVFVAADRRTADAFAAGAAGKWYMDIYRVARLRLAASGVHRAYGGEFCTATQPESFFSYRRDRICGRMGSLIWLS